jgi:hypothetical protein
MKLFKQIMMIAGGVLLLSACKKDDGPGKAEEPPKEGRFVISALPYMSYIMNNGADILYTSNTLDSGVLVTAGRGVEQDGVSRNYLTHNNLFFSLLFGQGNPGAVTTYNLNASGALTKMSDFQSETVTARGIIGDDILMIKNAWEPTQEYSSWYRVSTKTLQIVAQGEINTNTLSANGEMALFTSIHQVGNKVFAPFLSMKTGRSFGTAFADSSWIAVYSYPDMKLEKVIRDNRTGAIGAYFADGMEVDENGDVYAVGTSLGTSDGRSVNKNSTKPVGIMKIKKGTTEHDKSYFFDITEASGGKYVFRKLYMGKGYFLLMMSDTHATYANLPKRFAIANVYDKTFKWVTGAPDPANIYQVSEYSTNYSPRDGKSGYVAMMVADPVTQAITTGVYKFDAPTATASLGLTVSNTTDMMSINIITSINWVTLN